MGKHLRTYVLQIKVIESMENKRKVWYTICFDLKSTYPASNAPGVWPLVRVVHFVEPELGGFEDTPGDTVPFQVSFMLTKASWET